jgi:hypothetical protein
MYYVRSAKDSRRRGHLVGCRRDVLDAMDDARALGPGASVELRDGTVLAEFVEQVASWDLKIPTEWAGGGSTGAALGLRFSMPTLVNVGVGVH